MNECGVFMGYCKADLKIEECKPFCGMNLDVSWLRHDGFLLLFVLFR